MSRPKKPTTLIQEAVTSRNITDLYWAFLQHSVAELREEGTLKTFSGNHIVAMLQELQKLEAQNETETNETEVEKLKNFLTIPAAK